MTSSELTSYLLLFTFFTFCFVGLARADTDWPQFRGPTGQGHSSDRGLPLEWSESQNVVWKTAIRGRGWSSPVVADGRVWVTTAVNEARGASLRALAFDVESGRRARQRRGLPTLERQSQESEEQSCVAHANRRRRSRLPALRRRRDGRDRCGVGRDRLEGAVSLCVAARRRRIAGPLQGPADFQRRRPLRGVGDRARQAHGQGAMENGAAEAVRPGLHDAAGDFSRRARSSRQRRRVSRSGLRSRRPAKKSGWSRYEDGFSNVPRPVFGHGLLYIATGFQQPALLAVRPDGNGRCHRDAHRVVDDARCALHAVAAPRRRRAVRHQRSRRRSPVWTRRRASCTGSSGIGGNHSASPIFADGRIYFLSEEGVATVIAPGKTFQKLAVNELDGATLASMAVSRGSIFIRSLTHLYRIAGSQ